MHSLPRPRLAMMSRPACGCRVTRRVSSSLKEPSAAVVTVAVDAELLSWSLPDTDLAAPCCKQWQCTQRESRLVRDPGLLVCCSGDAAGLMQSHRCPCRRLFWPHALCPASAGDHSLVQGLKGDATYLVVTDQGEIEKYGINGVALPPALSSGRCHGSAVPM